MVEVALLSLKVVQEQTQGTCEIILVILFVIRMYYRSHVKGLAIRNSVRQNAEDGIQQTEMLHPRSFAVHIIIAYFDQLRAILMYVCYGKPFIKILVILKKNNICND